MAEALGKKCNAFLVADARHVKQMDTLGLDVVLLEQPAVVEPAHAFTGMSNDYTVQKVVGAAERPSHAAPHIRANRVTQIHVFMRLTRILTDTVGGAPCRLE